VFAPGAGRFVGPPAAAAIVLAALWFLRWLPSAPGLPLGLLGLAIALAAFFAIFFRDPERTPGAGIVSAADGRIRAVEREGEYVRISVFMNVTNVHVNRLPVDATVAKVENAGRGYRPAYAADADRNVARRYALATSLGPVEIVQITGIFARRLVSFVGPGARGRKGDRFGMIVLGSRVDVLLPAARTEPVVAVGDRVRAGITTIARETP
jgi:phosphatidylserine decarboxylase